MSHPAERLTNTNLEEQIGREKLILEGLLEAEGWVSCQLPQSSGPASLAAEGCTETGGVGCTSCPAPAAPTPCHPLRAPVHFLHFLHFSLSPCPQKTFLCKEELPLFEPSPLGSCGSRCAGGEQTPPAGASPLPTCSQS